MPGRGGRRAGQGMCEATFVRVQQVAEELVPWRLVHCRSV